MNINIYDIETMRECFIFSDLDIVTQKRETFEISYFRNDLYAMVKYLKGKKDYYQVGFNNVGFDSQVVQFILDSYEKWIDWDVDRILETIYQFAQDVIDDINNGLFPPYKENWLDLPQIDLFKIHHYDNEARRCSLKWLEFSMDMENIEEMPIHHGRRNLTKEEIAETIKYCWNDIDATYRFYLITTGETEIEEYKGKNKIQDRLDIMEEMKLPKETMNYSDVKIGDELNKIGYCKEAKVTTKQLFELKKGRLKSPKTKRSFTYGECIPDYVSFKTKEFQDFFSKMKRIKVNLFEKEEYPLIYNGTRYMIAKGGIHSNEKKRIILPADNELLIDADVGSQYPNAIRKRSLYPSHLGVKWLINYVMQITMRLDYKKRGSDKTNPKYRVFKGLAELFKLALNGGGFGKTNEKTNWQYDPYVMYRCTIGNQFEILMLIESLELSGIHIVSANTDGIVSLLSKDLEDKYYEICHAWEKIVGNEGKNNGELEYTYYKKLVQTSVNDYIAIDKDGKVKKKGDFSTSFELHKNKSRRIIPLALEKYFIDDIPVEQTIKNHTNIFDFCIGVKASTNYHYEAIDRKTGERDIYHRIVRYFMSNRGKKLLKIKNEDSDATGPEISQCEAGDNLLSTIFNIAQKKEMIDYDINYNYYIDKAQEMIDAIEKPRKKKLIVNKDQLKLF